VRVFSSSTHNRLKLLCPTRWVDRHDSIIIFLESFDAIVDSLSEVCTWLDKDASSGAYQMLCAIKQPEFILATYILGHIDTVHNDAQYKVHIDKGKIDARFILDNIGLVGLSYNNCHLLS